MLKFQHISSVSVSTDATVAQ